jgi:hypothetical protein
VKPTFRTKCPSLRLSAPPPAQCTTDASRMIARITTITQKKNTTMPGMAYPATVLALATATSYSRSSHGHQLPTAARLIRRDLPETTTLDPGRSGVGTTPGRLVRPPSLCASPTTRPGGQARQNRAMPWPDSNAYSSLSHKRSGVSDCEIRCVRVHGTLLPGAMTSAALECIRLAERSISRCGTHRGLCDRLIHAG